MRYIPVAIITVLLIAAITYKDELRHAMGLPTTVPQISVSTDTSHTMPGVKVPIVTSSGDEQTLSHLKAVGRIVSLQGTAAARDKEGRIRQLSGNSLVHEGDLLETAANAQLLLELDDGEQIYIKPRTQLIIETFQNHTANRSSIKRLLRGSLRLVSGDIGTSTQDTYQLKTHIATIGLEHQNSEYGVTLCIEDECLSELGGVDSGLYLSVIYGTIVSKSQAGHLTASAGQTFHQLRSAILPTTIHHTPGLVFSNEEIHSTAPTDALSE